MNGTGVYRTRRTEARYLGTGLGFSHLGLQGQLALGRQLSLLLQGGLQSSQVPLHGHIVLLSTCTLFIQSDLAVDSDTLR